MATDTQQCLAHYGDPSKAAFIAKWMARHELPEAVKPYFPMYGGTIKPTAVYMNKFAAAALDAVLLDLLATGLIKEFKSYDGCHNIRLKRGLSEYSIHAWGLALDFNAAQNPLGVKWGSRPGMFSKAFLDVWRKHGWVCGADFSRADGMHFQFTTTFPKA
ncbi:MAG: M15 family metallopeptidase [Janthinobacterium lividum]